MIEQNLQKYNHTELKDMPRKDQQGQANYIPSLLKDDFFTLYGEQSSTVYYYNYKIIEIQLYCDEETIQTVSFVYQHQGTKQIVKGALVLKSGESESQKHVFKLNEGEYLQKIQFTHGLVICDLIFITSQDRVFGKVQDKVSITEVSKIQQDFSKIISAPKDYHLSCFRIGLAYHREEQTRLSYIGGNVFSQSVVIESQQMKQRLQSFRNILVDTLDYLTVQDYLHIIQTCKQLAVYKFDPIIVNYISNRFIFMGYDRYRTYVSNQIKILQSNNPEVYLSEAIQRQEYTKNLVSNPKLTSSYTVVGDVKQNDEEFCTSYNFGGVVFEKQLTDIMTEEQLNNIVDKQGVILCGASFRNAGPKGVMKMKLQIIKRNSLVFAKIYDRVFIDSSEKQNFIMTFENENNLIKKEDINDLQIQCEFMGEDTVSWAGYFGARISDIFVRVLPLHSERQVHYSDYLLEQEKVLNQNTGNKMQVIIQDSQEEN